ncbi:MAG: diphthamide biosynthesis enzyme Dph2 [Thaumarchaeota archaeon]|nr:diphthamide biosynthesis enzyme Dph2 [Nitrososphaerota archaeon]MCL5318220.1 diphthamide biosynthesis enzyme Dph2 [Nitrososphaerota archaeon]
MKIDEERVVEEVRRVKPRLVLLSCPEGYLRQVEDLASRLEREFGVETMVSADLCYGVCDTADSEALKLGADLAFHIGHRSGFTRIGERTVMVDVFDDADFTKVVEKAVASLKPYQRLGLCTISQHLHRLDSVKELFESAGFEVYVGKGHERLLDGQVMGCRFTTSFRIRDEVDALVFLGQSRFHAVGVALSSGKPTFMLDPYSETIEDMGVQAEQWGKRTVLQVYKAVDAKRFGIIIGLREGQMLSEQAIHLKKRFQEHGREARLITLREVTEERLAPFRDLDAFIQTACPRISIDGSVFSRPVLSTPQAEALFRLWEGKDISAFLERSSWV